MNDKLDELHYIYKMIGNYGFCTVQELLDKYNDLQQENKQLKERLENVMTMTACGDKKQIKNTAQYKLEKVQQQNQELKDNWNKLKEYMIKEQARIVIENTDEDEFVYTDLLNKMQELERSDSNE